MKTILYSAAVAVALAFTACSAKADKAAQDTAIEEAPLEEVTVTEEAVVEVEPGDSISLTPELVTFVDFNADWCGPCQQFKPVFHEVAKQYAGKAAFLSVNTDSCPELAKQFQVTAIPQISIVTPSGEITSSVGSMTIDEFTAVVKKALGE
ncbi:MAG: hypothetical protein HDS02_01110 [Bacteroides sp.]|nr:hypothetical protein [Bacteroides sp.]MBD5331142.1 hypothetical protein [Bacteroides sp.]MBD5375846.1 hypothetical protein [Bacteroides sp.]MDE7461385.1 hypothetical protein [Paramuribaculum sp.]